MISVLLILLLNQKLPVSFYNTMEKQHPSSEANASDMGKIKAETSTAWDAGFGQVLEVESTPEQQRKVLLKLDLL